MLSNLADETVSLIRTILIWATPALGIALILFNAEVSSRTSAKAKEQKEKLATVSDQLEVEKDRVATLVSTVGYRNISESQGQAFKNVVGQGPSFPVRITIGGRSPELKGFGEQLQRLFRDTNLPVEDKMPMERIASEYDIEVHIYSEGHREYAEKITEALKTMGYDVDLRKMSGPEVYGMELILGTRL